MKGVAFLREKVREGRAAAARLYRSKGAEDEGVAHGATPDPDLDGILNAEYRQQNLLDGVDRAFAAYEQYAADPSAMTQPGVLHGALNQWNAEQEAPTGPVAPPLIKSPTAG